MRRTQKDYGLPILTFDEMARVLGSSRGEVMNWVMDHMNPGEARWSKWKNGKEPLPEATIRLYLMWLHKLQPAPTQAALTESQPEQRRPRVKEGQAGPKRRAG